MTTTGTADRLARRWFWALLLIAVVAMGALYAALGTGSGPSAGAAVGLSSVVLLASATQAGRILLALERARRPGAPEEDRPEAASGGRITMAERLLGAQATSAAEMGRRS